MADQKYIVKSLAVSGKGSKIFRAKDEVSANDFPEGHAEKLVEQGHLKRKPGPKSKGKDSEKSTDQKSAEKE